MATGSDETGLDTPPAATRPTLKIVNADATPEEIAAIVAVFASLGGDEPAPKPRRSEWNHPARGVRRPAAASWRTSTLPY